MENGSERRDKKTSVLTPKVRVNLSIWAHLHLVCVAYRALPFDSLIRKEVAKLL